MAILWMPCVLVLTLKLLLELLIWKSKLYSYPIDFPYMKLPKWGKERMQLTISMPYLVVLHKFIMHNSFWLTACCFQEFIKPFTRTIVN
jgi:hypothetical protein